MGYNTRFTLKTTDTITNEVLGDEFLNALNMYEGEAEWTEGRLFDGESVKWYDHHKDMLKASDAYKHVLFVLDGEGEESGDIWRTFYLDGKSYKWSPEIVLPEFSEEIRKKLK